ncbi:MAG: hypothetical protein CMB99_14840 [Flavobacteriaceae bacterium]|nr:hypothetical protein [Flavobacteriaceae bacterium]|tara:strand:+ start:261423 stop:261845 length:423 start_codon:yes stop_codon:yes gene_type:complete
MELSRIEKLVEKYLKAETTLQEENTLKNYFIGGNVAPHLQEYEYMFSYFTIAKEEVLEKPIVIKKKTTFQRNIFRLSIAASFALLFSVFLGYNQYQRYQAEKKFAEVSKGLELLSTTLKKGENAVAGLYTYEKAVNKILD